MQDAAVIVRSAAGETVVEQEPSVGCIQGSNGNGEAFRERLPKGKIERGVTREMAWIIERSVGKARAVVDIAASGDLMRQGEIETRVEGVALIVIE